MRSATTGLIVHAGRQIWKYLDEYRRCSHCIVWLNSPNLNADAERFVRTLKETWLGRMFLIGKAYLDRAVAQFVLTIIEN
jgi:hypothetical protein